MTRIFFATYRGGYTVYVTFAELQALFGHKRKPIRCGKVFRRFMTTRLTRH